jgi:hypothetical protein
MSKVEDGYIDKFIKDARSNNQKVVCIVGADAMESAISKGKIHLDADEWIIIDRFRVWLKSEHMYLNLFGKPILHIITPSLDISSTLVRDKVYDLDGKDYVDSTVLDYIHSNLFYIDNLMAKICKEFGILDPLAKREWRPLSGDMIITFRHYILKIYLKGSADKEINGNTLLQNRGFKCPKIVKRDGNKILFERVMEDSLKHLLTSADITASTITNIMIDVGRLYSKLHHFGLLHGDANTENVLCGEEIYLLDLADAVKVSTSGDPNERCRPEREYWQFISSLWHYAGDHVETTRLAQRSFQTGYASGPHKLDSSLSFVWKYYWQKKSSHNFDV